MAGHHAIQSSSEDILGRGAFVKSLAQAVRAADASEGAVIGLIGPWGVGKTSVLNLLKEELKVDAGLKVTAFDPWLFSGTGELISSFFAELSRQLREAGEGSKTDKWIARLPRPLRSLARRFKSESLLDLLDTYGQSIGMLRWLPGAGPWIGRAEATAQFFGRAVTKKLAKAPSLAAQRDKLIKALRKHDGRIVVIIDDLDRLQPREVADILQLVRLTGQFPNLIYVISFDRERVERVLVSSGFEGQAYLEKIIEYAYNVPPVSPAALDAVFVDKLDELLKRFSTATVDRDRWPDVAFRLRPLFRDLRDVHRYFAALPAALIAISDEVALVDVLALEALRVLRPDVYKAIARHSRALTDVGSVGQQANADTFKKEVEVIVEAIPADEGGARAAVSHLLRLLFPATAQYFDNGLHYDATWESKWRRERRVANIHVLNFYLEKTLSPDTAAVSLMEQVVACLTNEEELQRLLDSLEDKLLRNVIERLGSYGDDFTPAAVEPGLNALLSLSRRAEAWLGAFGADGARALDAVMMQLASAQTDPAELLALIDRVVERQTSLYDRLRLLRLAPGIADRQGNKLFQAADFAQLKAKLWPLVRSATTRQLVSEAHPLTLLYNAVLDNRDDRATINEQLAEPDVMAAVLRDSLDNAYAQNFASVAVQRETRLAWDALEMVCDGADGVTRLIRAFRARADSDTLADPVVQEALTLIDRHLESGAPPLKWAKPVRQSQFASSRTRDMLHAEAAGKASLSIRTATIYAVGAQQAARASLLDSAVHQRLFGYLTSSELVDRVQLYCNHHSLATDGAGQPELDNNITSVVAVLAQRVATTFDAGLEITLRVGIVSPTPGVEHVRVITEAWFTRLSDRNPEESEKQVNSAPLFSLMELRDLLVAMLGTAAGIGQSVLPGIYGDNMLPHASTELYLKCGDMPSPAMPELIDLAPLGDSVWSSAPREGDFGSIAPIETTDDRRYVVNEALRYIAGSVWRYPNADAGLLQVLLRPDAAAPASG